MILIIQTSAEIAFRTLEGGPRLEHKLVALANLEPSDFLKSPNVHAIKLPGEPKKPRYAVRLSDDYRAIVRFKKEGVLVVEDVFNKKRLDGILHGAREQ